ncbi:MT0933-like antitoxin protein [Microbacterium sp. ru370.1]|uniref:antitoxin n=1 Tax=unclassified Microbacterium TaxID=2609290 RepID=UPI00087EBFDD|nr:MULTISPECIES: antitoxin [unclassified Microbacterium]SDO27938.1 MT0933-like antitoxin protein [Microbacterium sp. ru370.1]SIT74981.1 MT0933-like antitoxin protein [Microbacterium sp. RU1D]
MADLGALGDKAKDAVNGEQGEQTSDAAIEKAGDAADSVSGGKFDDKIDAGEEAVDSKVGE